MGKKRINPPVAYACYNKDLKIRMSSTSGGMFTIIAEYIFKMNGVVYGAAFDDEFNVCHKRVTSSSELEALRGSKYPQSRMTNVYKNIKKDLENGPVLFVGTPCQNAALSKYIDIENENLWTIDFVCHGVGSPGIWSEYLDGYEKRDKIKSIFFKSKDVSWKKWRFKVEYVNKTKQIRGYMNPYMRSFLTYTNIRPSCYECHFKGIIRNTDFTISDCWGIGEEDKELNDDKGLSALLIHTERGLRLFKSVQDRIEKKQYDPYILMEGNFTAFRSVKKPDDRKAFFEYAQTHDFKKALKKYYVPSILGWLKYFLLCLIGEEK